jgi:uncharacterized membrane protein
MSETSGPFAPPPPSLWRWPLIVSICLNFLLIGLFCMTFVRFAAFGPGPDAHRGGLPLLGVGHGILGPDMMKHYTPDKAAALERVLDAHRAKLVALRAATFAARHDAAKVFLSNTDRPALDRALDRIRAADAAFEAETMTTVSECAVVLTPEERRAVAESWKHDHGMGRGMPFGFGMGPGHGRSSPDGN